MELQTTRGLPDARQLTTLQLDVPPFSYFLEKDLRISEASANDCLSETEAS